MAIPLGLDAPLTHMLDHIITDQANCPERL